MPALASANLLDSRMGRAIRALRGGGWRRRVFGVDTPQARKLVVFVYAGLLAGLRGWLYAHMQRSVNPTPFGLNAGIEYLLMAVVGGAAQCSAARCSAPASSPCVNDQLQDWLPKLIGARGNFETIVFGVMLVLALQAAPEGMWPHIARVRPRRARSAADAPALPARDMPAARRAGAARCAGCASSFGGLVAVNDVDFASRGGEIVGLIGPNGAGKSTTFNLLTGVDRPGAGERGVPRPRARWA